MTAAAALRDRVVAPLAAVLALYGGAVLLTITAITMLNVAGFALDALARPFGARVPGLSGYEEVVALLIGGGTLALLPWCQIRRGHVAVDLFTRRAPAALVRTIDRIGLLLTALMALGFALAMAAGMMQARSDGIVTGVRAWPEWPFWIPGIVALAVWSVTAAVMAAAPGRQAEDTDRDGYPHG
jgi:TRAP-type C4-dicarboxylate transport system permease small subunit